MDKSWIKRLNAADIGEPILIAPHTWWVGWNLTNDPFQCHTYLIEQGDNSILLDPGGQLTWNATLEKIEKVIPFAKIRYFICHHQDPDITSSLPAIDRLVTRSDAAILSHWRANALLKHYAITTPLACVEKMGWHLDLGQGRVLKFVFTPYLHFPGAFCTFDTLSGILFSSDLFGGFTDDWKLVAEDENHFENIRPFHEHYMPHKDVLIHGLSKLEPLPMTMIAPQHGSIIPGELIPFMFNQLKAMDCGLFLMTRANSDFMRLSRLNRMLKDVIQSMILHRDFKEVANAILTATESLIPSNHIEFYAKLDDDLVVHLAPESGFRGTTAQLSPEYRAFIGLSRDHWKGNDIGPYMVIDLPETPPSPGATRGLLLPLFSLQTHLVNALVIFRLNYDIEIDDELAMVLSRISEPLGVAIERETIFQNMEKERDSIYQRSIRDPLTNLYTRVYMRDAADRLCRVQDRDPRSKLVVAMLDIDHFKSVNDTYGHGCGDQVLQQVAKVLLEGVRSADVPVRLGGEEFVTFLVGVDLNIAKDIMDRVRLRVSQLTFNGVMSDRQVTISAGLASRHVGEPLDEVINRADIALYQAKSSGRNRVILTQDPESQSPLP
ncbi:MAG: diguanylate cyclase [Magnetococcales bacterium]|nr:diguanylate cyclase [Magnetococcales bacterium]